MISRFEVERLQAAGKLAEVQQSVLDLTQALENLDPWQPGVGLAQQGRSILALLENLSLRMDRKLTVTLVGPCGSGKSTLVNALLGGNAIVKMGVERPTTREVTVCCRQSGDAAHLLDSAIADLVKIETRGFPAHLGHLVLVDTPDTDSTAQDRHLPQVMEMVRHADILICVFNAENPKTKSHSDILAPLVDYFDGPALVAVLNRCDRLDVAELENTIRPQFKDYLKRSWGKTPQQVLAICARCHLQDPNWDPKAEPRHDLDQFSDLLELLSLERTNARTIVDHRLNKAYHLQRLLFQQVGQAATEVQPALVEASALLEKAQKKALQTALEAFGDSDQDLADTTHTYLHQQLAQRWVGPMGWLLAGWLRVVMFGSGLFSFVRWRRPLRQIGTMWRAVRPTRQTEPQELAHQADAAVSVALQAYHQKIEQLWPDVAEKLIEAKMGTGVRDSMASHMDAQTLHETLAQEWFRRWQNETHRVARGLSHPLLQILFNLPIVGLMGYIGWITVETFVRGDYLATGYFVHALMSLGFVTGLSFTAFQLCAKAFGRTGRIHRRTLLSITGDDRFLTLAAPPEIQQTIERLSALSRLK